MCHPGSARSPLPHSSRLPGLIVSCSPPSLIDPALCVCVWVRTSPSCQVTVKLACRWFMAANGLKKSKKKKQPQQKRCCVVNHVDLTHAHTHTRLHFQEGLPSSSTAPVKVTADVSGCGTAQRGVNTSDGERDALVVVVRRGGGSRSGSGRRRMEEDGVKKKKEWLAAEMPKRPQR